MRGRHVLTTGLTLALAMGLAPAAQAGLVKLPTPLVAPSTSQTLLATVHDVTVQAVGMAEGTIPGCEVVAGGTPSSGGYERAQCVLDAGGSITLTCGSNETRPGSFSLVRTYDAGCVLTGSALNGGYVPLSCGTTNVLLSPSGPARRSTSCWAGPISVEELEEQATPTAQPTHTLTLTIGTVRYQCDAGTGQYDLTDNCALV